MDTRRHLKRPHSDDSEAGSPCLDSPSSKQKSTQKSKKLKLYSTYTTESPFPNFNHPTPSEALDVYNLLFKAHRDSAHDPTPTRKPPLLTNNSSALTCGKVPNVIEALISTILSQNTSGKNSSQAKAALDNTFGKNNFKAIAAASHADLVDSIRSGGLANKKAKTIQNILKSVKERHGEYSLQHLSSDAVEGMAMTDDEIMKELISYDGVGPKTASCVLLFCLGRDSFAVDTHIFRLSKLLGWVPEKADRILTQAHLDIRIPANLKYGLHVLMIDHGRVCKGCKKKNAVVISRDQSCILKTYLQKERKLSIDIVVGTSLAG